MKQISTYSKMNAHLLTHTHISRITLYAAFLFIGVLCSVGNAWGAGAISVTNSAITLPRGSTTVTTGDWIAAAGVTKAGNNWAYSDWTGDQTIGTYGSITFSKAGDLNNANLLQLQNGGGTISTTITSPAGVDIVIGCKRGGAKGTVTVSLTGADDNTSFSSTSWSTIEISTTSTTAAFSVTKSGDNGLYISYITITPKAASSTYSVTYDGNGNTGGDVPTDATAYSSGATVTVKGNTGSLVKTGFTFGGWNTQPDGNGTNYTAGSGTFSISSNTILYAKWTNTYAGSEFTLVESLSELSAGSKVIIMDKDHATALSTTQSTNNRASIAASDGGGFTMSLDNKTATLKSATTVQVITLEDLATPVSNKYQFNVESGYLYAAGSGKGNNYLRTQTTNDDEGEWLIGLEDGVFSIVAKGDNTNNVMQKNNSSDFFSCYSSAGQKNVLIYVLDEGTKYDITWANGGHGTAPTSPTSASKVTLPEISATGYTHTGWKANVAVTNTSTSSSISAGTLIANGTQVLLGAATTFTAQWSPISYFVRFNSNDENYLGAAEGSMSNESYDYGESKALTTNAFSLAGYDFAGWATTPTGDVAYTDGASASNLSSTNEAIVDLYAIWTAKKYNVTLAATNETSSVGSQTVQATYNAAMPTTKKGSGAVAAPSRTGYTFTGWEYSSTTYYDYNAGTSTLTSAHVWDQPNNTTTLTPKWSINSYTLTWDLAGGTVSVAGTGAAEGATGTPNSPVEYNAAITVPTVTRAGYNFAGWDVTPASNMPASNTTYTATWTEKTVTGWTWTNHRGGATITSDPIVVYVGQKVRMDIAYLPADVLSTHTVKDNYAYTRSDGDSYLKYEAKASAYFTFSGKAAKSSTSITFTHTEDTSDPKAFAKTVNVEVRALPTDTYLDLVHGVSFSGPYGATLIDDDYGVQFTYTAPGGDVSDWSSSYANTCEQYHVHLIGWIESTWADEHLGDAEMPNTAAITSSGYYHPVGETMTVSGKTFYAVWAVEE